MHSKGFTPPQKNKHYHPANGMLDRASASVERVVLFSVRTPATSLQQARDYLDELAFLAMTAGAETVGRFTQNLPMPDSRTYIGTGKIQEIKAFVEENEVETAICDDELNTAIEGGQAPDLIFEGPERLIAQYAARGLLLDISDLKETAGGKQLYPSIVNTCSIDGKMYAFPISQMAHCMVINRDIFEKADALKYLNEETGTWNSVDDYFNAIQAVYDSGHKDVMTIYCGGHGGDQGTRHMISCPTACSSWSIAARR